MNERLQRGSAVLIVVLVLSALTAWCLNSIRTVSFSLQTALVRQEREQLHSVATAVIRYGIWLCTTRYASITEQALAGRPTFDCAVGAWKFSESGPLFAGKLHGALKDNFIALRATVLDSTQKQVFVVSCSLVRTQEGDKGQEKPVFVVQQWTSGV